MNWRPGLLIHEEIYTFRMFTKPNKQVLYNKIDQFMPKGDSSAQAEILFDKLILKD